MSNIITDLRQRFRQGSISLQLIYINIGVFLLQALVTIFLLLFNVQDGFPLHWFEMPADVMRLLVQPWSVVTYMFFHAGILHLLFNMLWLYWFGQLFLYAFSAKHLRGLYLLGGMAGALLYLLAYNLFPYFQPLVNSSMLVGASASVLAIVVASAVSMPDFRLNLLLFGQVKLKYVALVVVVTDLLFITSGNGGGHIAHLGGALAGWWFARGIRDGKYDATAWINRILDAVQGWFTRSPRKRKPRMKVYAGGKHGKDYDYNARKKAQDDEIDRILDKVRQSGYEGLTAEEKRRLFDASQR
ncbi:MAG: rhomboid family intramembrane serine protease [Bacteroidaceae bacterium]|nr:rhomboid family intramembrane serine protease [Bacteroidaceae bacterium]